MVKKAVAIFLALMLVTVVAIPAMIALVRDKGHQEEQVVWDGPDVKLLINATGEVITLSMEEYLVGVVAAEMPAAFEPEALKAQAVAARTYTLRKMQSQNDKHPEADICDDPDHCQAWLSSEDMQARWGITGYAGFKSKIRRAVQDTRGLILTYNNTLIDPVYHSTSGPQTENPENVWQVSVPYLQSVECRWDTESPRYQENKTYAWQELDRLLGTSLAAMPASTLSGSSSISVTGTTSTGRVQEVQVAGTRIPATDLRKALGLNSTNFSLERSSSGVTFTTTGFGHGVGLCQYGANGQAKEGRSFTEILTYYYTGVKLQRMSGY